MSAGGQDVAALAFAQHGGEVPVQQDLLKCGYVLGGWRFKRRAGIFVEDDQVEFSIIVETLNSQKNDFNISAVSKKILLAAACEDSKIIVKYIECLSNKLELQKCNNDTADVQIGMQTFLLPLSEDKKTPLAIIELEKNGLIQVVNNFATITERGLAYVHDIVKTTSKFIEKKIICHSCNLHFTVYSWYADAHNAQTLHCPECGQAAGHFSVYSQYNFGFIFQQVPGNATAWSPGQ